MTIETVTVAGLPHSKELDRLLADIDAVDADWRDALDRSVDSGRVVVTKSGDRIGGGL